MTHRAIVVCPFSCLRENPVKIWPLIKLHSLRLDEIYGHLYNIRNIRQPATLLFALYNFGLRQDLSRLKIHLADIRPLPRQQRHLALVAHR